MTGAVSVDSVVSKEYLENGLFRRVYKLFVLSTGRCGKIRSGRKYAVYYHKGNYDSISTIYPNLIIQIRNFGCIVVDDASDKCLITETVADCEEEYVTKISVKITDCNY